MRALIPALTLTAVLAAILIAQPASAAEMNRPCVRDARHEFKICRTECREEFLADKDMCRNIDHDCADLCRADLGECLDGPDGPLTRLEACRMVCLDTLDAAKESCRDRFAKGTPERDQCIDAAQIAAFVCRDTCREGVSADLRACRVAFRTCILGCPPPAE
jgi:hypothetical protein